MLLVYRMDTGYERIVYCFMPVISTSKGSNGDQSSENDIESFRHAEQKAMYTPHTG